MSQPPASLVPFNIMAKPVSGRCNLDCAYCYYTMKPAELFPDTPEAELRMSGDVLDSYVKQYMDANPVRCEFGWQGGEPTMAGLDFFTTFLVLIIGVLVRCRLGFHLVDS